MRDTLIGSAEVSTSLQNHMSVNKSQIQTTSPKSLKKRLFNAKQIFMFAVFDKLLLTHLGKTIVRRYVHDTDAQSVRNDCQDHMKSLSKDASEKRRLPQHVTNTVLDDNNKATTEQYITNTVLDDNNKGTTEQLVLHFNKQFRQLEEISDESEHFPPQVKLWLLQKAVRLHELRIVETLADFQSITTGYGKSSNLKYQTYYDLLINACVRCDRTKKANIRKRGYIYQAATYTASDGFDDDNSYEAPWGDPSQGIDTPNDEFYDIKTTHASPPMSSRHKLRPRLPRLYSGPNQFPKKPPNQKWTGPIYLPHHVYKL